MYTFTMLKQKNGKLIMEIPKSFLGYKRENGRAGTRNHVIILPVDDISNACAEAVANNIKGTIALPHSYGRLQFGADLELHFRTMIGTCLLYTSDAADDSLRVDLGGRRII